MDSFANDRKCLIFYFKFAIFAFTVFFYLQMSYGQQDSSADILSITTIPTCINVFGDGAPQTQQLCGTTGLDQNVAAVRLNIQVGPNVMQSANKLIFKSFPPEGTTSTSTPDVNNPCGNTPVGSNCTVFPSTIEVTWTTHSVVAGYSLTPIVDGVPFAYILYKAPFYGADDDEDMNWIGDGKGNCFFGADEKLPPGQSALKTPCIFQGAAAFTRNVLLANSGCTDTSVVSGQELLCNTASNQPSQCNCGANEVEIFGSCGGFIEECGGTTNGIPSEISQCSCFPYSITIEGGACDLDPNVLTYTCIKELKNAGCHTTNGHNYIDEGCASDGGLLQTKTQPDDSNGKFASAGGTVNYPNIAVAACRHMAYIVALSNSTNNGKSTIQPTYVSPFVKLDPSSPCATYSYSKNGKSFYGCGTPTCQTSGGRVGNACVYIQGDNPRYNRVMHDDVCIGVDTSNGQQGFTSDSCQIDAKCRSDDQCSPCNYYARWGPAWPLTGQPSVTSTGSIVNPIDNGVCVVCRADYQNSAYLPGLWGWQRKLKRLIDDWRESWIGSYGNANFILDPTSRSGSLPQSQTLGFNYYVIKNPQTGQNQVFVLQPVWSQQLLRSCDPLQSGDTCWTSYNMPPDFFSTGSSSGSSGPISTQGFESVTTPPSSFPQGYQIRGLAITPYWISPACSDGSFCGGHIYRCGHYCDPDFINGYVNSFNTRRIAKDPSGMAVAKGFTGLGPLGSALAVSRQAKIITGVDFFFTYNISATESVTQKMTLTTDSIGGGNSVSYLDFGSGVVGRINNINTPNGQTAPILGGVVVVQGSNGFGSNEETGYGVGSILGQLNADAASISVNPWNDITWLLQKVEGFYKGITGYKNGGCALPIAPFVTAMQCFSVGYACYAPWDLCDAIYQTCQNLKDTSDTCEARNIKPVRVINQQKSNSVNYVVVPAENLPDDDKSNAVTCNAQTSDPVKGMGWYWMEPKTINAFGTKCGQYGMNPWTFGKDSATQYYICEESSASDKNGVPCVPGISENTNVQSPCQILGGLANFHGQSSIDAPGIFVSNQQNGGTVGSRQNTACFSTAQQQLILNNQGSAGIISGCNSEFTNLGNVPVTGLTPNWNYLAPTEWINKNYLLTTNTQITNAALDVSLYISGYGLNAEVTTVDNAKFVNQNNLCVIFQDSNAGQANLTVQNIGSSFSEYVVNLINCTDLTGTFQGPVGTSTNSPTNGIEPGQIEPFNVGLFFGSLQNVKSLRCFFSVSPSDFAQNIILDEVAINCNVAGFLQQASIGEVGNDGLILGPNVQATDPCQKNPGFGCWLINGGLLSKVTADIFIVLMAIATIVFLVFIARYFIYQNRYEQLSMKTRKQEQKLNEVQTAVKKEHEAEVLKVQEELREESFQRNVPQLAEAIGSAVGQAIIK